MTQNDTKSLVNAARMTQKRVKKIMCKRYNLLKYLPRHNKCTKQTSTFFPIAHWFMNIPRGGTNFISFLILVNIKWSSTIVISRITSIIKHRKGITTQWKKQSENVTNIKNIDVIFWLPELIEEICNMVLYCGLLHWKYKQHDFR